MSAFHLRKRNLTRYLPQSNRILNLGTAFTFLTAFQLYAGTSYSQTTTLSLSLKNATLEQAIDRIEEETGYSFLYADHVLDVSRVVNLEANNKDINLVLSRVFDNMNVDYKIVDKQIILSHKLESIPLAQQQGHTVQGVVLDSNQEPVIGANVLVKGTTVGTITDIDGRFTLEVPDNAVLVVSYIGYLSKELVPGSKTDLTISLKEDSQNLDEVVVVGYGTMRKSDVTGSIGVAKGDDLTKNQNFSALDNLRGKVSGVNIFSNSSQPGAYSNRVVIRGMATINASSNPLYVVDGVVMENFDLVNPNDIESMEVLKDASAAAIYGARGANGVIMVTTKRGKKDGEGVQVSYQGSVSASHIARKMDTMNAQEWCDAFMIGLENENKWQGKNWSLNRADWFNDSNFFDASGNPLYDTNWQDEATRTAVSHNHQLNIQQAGKNSSMGAFLNYTDQQGIVNNTYNKRINAKLAYDANPTKWLSTAVNVLVNHTWGRYTPEDGGGQEARRTMIEMVPWMPIRDKDGKYTTSTSSSIGDVLGFEGMSNPVMILDMQKRMRYNTQVFGNAALTFHLAEGLDLKTQLGLDHHNRTYRGYSSIDLNNISMPNGWAEYQNWNTLYWQEETYLTYNKAFGDHRINAMAGLSWQERVQKWNKARTTGFSDDFFEDNNMSAGTTPDAPESSYDRWAMNSYFLRFAYTYKDRYSATVTGRVDGSSKFGENNKYAFFPSAGLAWNVIQEDFMQDQSTISNLKLHTSYGLTGNSEIGVYKSLATVTSETLLLNGTRNSYSYLNRLPNSDLKWEKTAQFDIGFDLGLFNNRITLDASYYNKKTSDLLLDAPVPHTTGFETVYKNIGSIRNQGLDLMLSTRNIDTKDFTWTTSINANFNKNKILSLGDNDEDILKNEWVSGASILRVGESVGSFYGYKRLGVYTIEDYEAGNCEKKQIGRAKRSSEREIIGKGVPDWTGSMINTLRYKNWDFTLDLQFVAGVQTLQQFYHSTYDRFGQTNGLTNILYDAYNGTNPNSMQQAIWLFNGGHAGQDTLTDSQWVANGSYLRANLIQLGYTFDSNQLAKTPFSSLRLYLNVNNAFLITAKDFNGYDPESTSQISTSNGSVSPEQFGQNMAFFSYPRARTFTLGVNVTF